MLSIIGKVSAIATIAGGALLLDVPDAMAAAPRECTWEEWQIACADAPSYYDQGWWCSWATSCEATDIGNGQVTLTYGYQFYFSGTEPCPSSQPCI